MRKELVERSQSLCEMCGKGGVVLQAAHLNRRWRIEGRTTVQDLAHLCVPCHIHADQTKPGREWLKRFGELLKMKG